MRVVAGTSVANAESQTRVQMSSMVRLTERCVLSMALLAHCCRPLTVMVGPQHGGGMETPGSAEAGAESQAMSQMSSSVRLTVRWVLSTALLTHFCTPLTVMGEPQQG